MAEWFVKYRDLQTNREMESRRMDTREQAISQALAYERDRSIIHAIVGPSGEEPWAEVKLET